MAEIKTESVKYLKPGDALLVVDVQPDFCPGGALPIENGDKVIPVLNEWMKRAQRENVPVYASRDWHPMKHLSFAESGGKWPPHCVQDTAGAQFHPALDLPADVYKISKGVRFDKDQYSAFDETGLAEHLRNRGIRRVWVGGLAQDVCVEATAKDAAKEGFDTWLIRNATFPVTAKGGQRALREMQEVGVQMVES